MRVTFTISRFNPETDPHSYTEERRLNVRRGMTVLDGLISIKNAQDGSLSLRYSCRSAICGSCAMEINGSEKLACRASIRAELERYGRITVAPLRNLPVIKDLVVDMSSFWRKVQHVTPWLLPSLVSEGDVVPPTQMTLPRTSSLFHNVDACIMCGACVAACTTHEVSTSFIGPAALAKADRFLEDPRESELAKLARLQELDRPHGMWDCVRCNLCVEVCPKDVKPMDAIIRLRRAAISRGVTGSGGARHIMGFTQLVHEEGRLNESLMPLKVIGFHPTRLFKVLPLALKMLLRGKIPNPFTESLPGIAQIQAIFRAFTLHRHR